ncbi:MAG: HlyC/CorC family transporter [Gammaproteobacteria bacterium]
MDDIPLSVLFGALVCLIVLSAFFSGSETGLMTLNRYRLRHLAKAKHPGAVRAARLLENPDRLIGLILLGNNFVNILASSLATIIALRLGNEGAIAIAAGLLTLVVLIFAEVAPKTYAALHPERIAFPAAFIYKPLLRILYPLVWTVNLVVGGLLRLFRVRPADATTLSLSTEELRTVVNEAGAIIPQRHQRMLLSILDLEKVTVEDIMVPRNEIIGIDIEDSWDDIEQQLINSQYTKLPVYRDSIDNVIGFLYLRNFVHLLRQHAFAHQELLNIVREPYFIPEGTPLNKQLLNFQRMKRRIGLVVDEYGDIMGLATLEDILEEIVGEFTTDPSTAGKDIHPQEDGSYMIDGSVHVRELNRALHWELPTSGPKTLNGLILEYMETIPEPGTSLLLAGYPVEIVQIKDNVVKTVRIQPRLPGRAEGGAPGKSAD